MPSFKPRKFKIRVQMRDASSKKPRRISLVSQRRITVNGKVVRAGERANPANPSQLKEVVASRRPARNTNGGKLRSMANIRGKK